VRAVGDPEWSTSIWETHRLPLIGHEAFLVIRYCVSGLFFDPHP
jgi:hypothetical protein